MIQVLIEHYGDSFILYMRNPRTPITVDDLFSQLFWGYNSTGTNQPVAASIADQLEDEYRTYGSSLSRNVLPPHVQNFLFGYLQAKDPDNFNKILPLHPGGDFRWWKLQN